MACLSKCYKLSGFQFSFCGSYCLCYINVVTKMWWLYKWERELLVILMQNMQTTLAKHSFTMVLLYKCQLEIKCYGNISFIFMDSTSCMLQFSQVQFTFMMLFKSITYIQHAQKNFLKASCLHLCSNYLWSNLSLTCKRSLCWPQWEQESLKLVAAAWLFQKLKSWRHLMHVCYKTQVVLPFSISWTNFTIYC